MEHTQRQIFKGFGSTLPERSTTTLTKIVVIRRRGILYSVGIYCVSGDVAWHASEKDCVHVDFHSRISALFLGGRHFTPLCFLVKYYKSPGNLKNTG